MVYELFDVLLNCLLKFCWGFLHLCSSVRLACSFHFCVFFIWFWNQGDGGLVEWVRKCSFLCNFWKSFRRIGISSSLNVLIEFSCEAIWSWAFLGGRFLVTASISVLVIGLLRIPISSWFSLGRLNFSKNLSTSSRLSILLPYKLFIILSYNPCISALPVVTSPFSFIILLIWFFSFFSWWVWLKVSQLCLSSQRTSF